MSGENSYYLRQRAMSKRTPGGELVYASPSWLEAAADEIDQLQLEVDRLRNALIDHMAEQHPPRLPPLTPEALAEMERHQRNGGRELL